jgi:hypothetical protein
MTRPLHVDISKEQRSELIDVRDHHEKPHMREKAAAVLKVAGPPEEEGNRPAERLCLDCCVSGVPTWLAVGSIANPVCGFLR